MESTRPTTKKCMETAEKPQISILMAIYEPRMDWLREQLQSLDSQTYPNLKLYIRDDCSPTVPFVEIQSLIKDCISAFPYELKRNEKNMGSNGTFERLTQEADGDYFAYCDQDDIWLPEKLERLEGQLSCESGELICSDVLLIDGQGNQFADSITALRPRHVFRQGSGLAPTLIYRNFAIGCTMLVDSGAAKAALPFAKTMVHDHYLAFFCAMRGPILVCPEHLVRYRIHDHNQTSVLAKVQDCESYRLYHMQPFYERIKELSERFQLPELTVAEQWARARMDNAERKHHSMRALWKLRACNQTTTLFELVALRMPNSIFQWMLHQIQRGKV